jgi:hypothetical protein
MGRYEIAYLILLISVISVLGWFALFTAHQLVTDRPRRERSRRTKGHA